MKRVGAPAVSPNGKWVVFPVLEPAYDERDQVSDLWIVPADGSAPARRLTHTKAGESGVVWSPDSSSIAFTSRREGDEASQVYVLHVSQPGEARRITNLLHGASAPRWRPDGGALLFTSTVYPGAADDEANRAIAGERKARKHKARVYESFPVRHWDHWIDEPRVHLLVQELAEGSKARDLFAGSKLAAAPGFGGVMGSTSDELPAVWTPDGQSVIFAATTGRDTAAFAEVRTHLYQVSANGGEPAAITAGSDSFTNPVFRPDGKAFYALAEAGTGKNYNLARIVRFSWPQAGRPQVIAPAFDRSADTIAFSPDSKTVYTTAEDAGHVKVYSLPAEGGAATLALDAPRGQYTNLAIGGAVMAATFDSAVQPPEVVRIDIAAGRHQALTRFNADAAARIDWKPLEEFWFTSKGGRRIHNLIALPPGFDPSRKYPLISIIHGGPHTMHKDYFFLRWNPHLLAAPGYVILMTNYTGSTGFGEAFAQAIQGDPLRTPGAEIDQAADEAVKRYPYIDATRLAAGGASYGGHLANWLQASTTRYKCLLSHAGLINLESQWGTSDTIYSREVSNGGPVWEQGPVWREQNPIRHAARFRTPMMLTVGENDFRVPLNQTLENWSVLQRLKIPRQLIVFPDANHWILKGEDNRFFYGEVHAWFARWLR